MRMLGVGLLVFMFGCDDKDQNSVDRAESAKPGPATARDATPRPTAVAGPAKDQDGGIRPENGVRSQGHQQRLLHIGNSPKNAWGVDVCQDGSGSLTYGSGPGAYFPPKTFDGEDVISRLKPKLKSARPSHVERAAYCVELMGRHGTEPMWTEEAEPIAEVFELFRKACREGKAGIEGRAFANVWREYPPTPLSRAWDEKGERPVVTVSGGLRWTLVIKEDGSGDVAYPISAYTFYRAGTFDVQAIVQRLKSQLSPKRLRFDVGPYMATLLEDRGKSMLYSDEPDPIADVFELARQAAREGKGEGFKVFEEMWREHRPTPVNEPWNLQEKSGKH